MAFAEAGFDLLVDLSRTAFERVESDAAGAPRDLGGVGAAARLMRDRAGASGGAGLGTPPLVFSAGLLAGTPAPGANRTIVSTVAHDSGRFVSSGFEGFFAPELKYAGYDRLVITGRAPALSYLLIRDERVEVRDASHLAGLSAARTAAAIRKELNDPKLQIAALGPAGENLAPQATIEHANSCATAGPGAVMGAKNLKAVAVRGTRDLTVARAAELFMISSAQNQAIYDNPLCGDLFLTEADEGFLAGLTPPGSDRAPLGFWSPVLDERMASVVEREHVYEQWENYSQEMEEVREIVVERSRRARGTGCYNCPRNCHSLVTLPGGRTYFLKSSLRLAEAFAGFDDLPLTYETLYALQELGLDEYETARTFALVDRLHREGTLDLPDYPADQAGRFLYVAKKIAEGEALGAPLPPPEPFAVDAARWADDCLGLCPLLSSTRVRFGGRPPYDLKNIPGFVSAAVGAEFTAEALESAAREGVELVRELDAALAAAGGVGR